MISPNYLSYKDLTARVVNKDGKFLRIILNSYKEEYNHLMNSGLFEELIENNLLIIHKEISLTEINDEIYKVIFPTQITFQSYPFEWSYKQWLEAILTFLKINIISLKYGMILKDATPYNFCFEAGNCVMFDTSSFIFFKKNDKWKAYHQFCQEFLSPLALMYYNGPVWGKLYMSNLRGISLDFVSKQLPKKSWFNLSVLLHIHLHSRYFVNPSKGNKKSAKGFSLDEMESLFSMIKSSVNTLKEPYLTKSYWDRYYVEDIETVEYIVVKESIVKKWLQLLKPDSILDLGSNTGKFSIIASSYAKKVISLESDEFCVDEIFKQIRLKKINNIYPLIGNLAEPSPSLGMLNKELASLFQRANSEVVLSLAIIHHLYFTMDMSFAHIAELFSKFRPKYLIVEFIPNSDRKVVALIESKPHRELGYTLESFNLELSFYFLKMEEVTLFPSSRCLILYKAK
jgi:hypothetical protein